MFSIEGSAPSVASPVTPDLLKHFAFEAESLGNYELAERFYKEVGASYSELPLIRPPLGPM